MLDKLFVKKWNIGLAKINFEQLLSDGLENCNIHWMPEDDVYKLKADPFIIKNDSGQYHVLYEAFCYHNNYGTISLAEFDANLNFVSRKEDILDTGSHLSYPFIIKEKDECYVIPEGSKSNQLNLYRLSAGKDQLSFSGTLMDNVQLLDPTIIFWEGKYWLFATKRGANSNSHLYLYYADDWRGPYREHAQSPVKTDKSSARPAGGIINYKGSLYRPSMDCSKYYGKSIILNKIEALNEKEFREKKVKAINLPSKHDYSFAIHTINFADDVIVIDGLKKIFNPWAQLQISLSKWKKALSDYLDH